MRRLSKLKLNNGFMEIKNKTELKAEMYFYGDIVSAEWSRWDDSDQCPESVKKILDEVKDVNELDIYINSGGGSVFAGMAIYNMLKRNQAFKTVHVDGLAGSISSVIAMAGDRILIPSNAYLMIHKASSGVWGNSNEMKKMADRLEVIEEGILNVYSSKLKDGIEIEEIKQMMEDETWFTGKKASEYFNIEVDEELQAVASVSDLSAYNKIPTNFNKKIEDVPKVNEEPTKNVSSFFNIRKKLLNT